MSKFKVFCEEENTGGIGIMQPYFGFKSENLEILGAIDDIIKVVGKKVIWANKFCG